MAELFLSPAPWIALLSLTLIELILGIDNIIFITIIVDRMAEHQRGSARHLGLLMAMGSRIALLLSITWIMRLNNPLITLFGHALSGRDLILLFGGLFLLTKATREIHDAIDPEGHSLESPNPTNNRTASFILTLVQIAVVDIVFSLDSVITAIGLAEQLWVMIAAIVLSVGVMMYAAKSIGDFISTHPTFKLLALSFLILVGLTLIGEGLDYHVPKGYIYFAIAFSFVVEILNSRLRPHENHHAQTGDNLH